MQIDYFIFHNFGDIVNNSQPEIIRNNPESSEAITSAVLVERLFANSTAIESRPDNDAAVDPHDSRISDSSSQEPHILPAATIFAKEREQCASIVNFRHNKIQETMRQAS